MVQSAIAVADREPVAPAAPATVTEVCDDLLKLFGSVSDGRSGQGRGSSGRGGIGAGRGGGRGGDEGLYGDRRVGQRRSAPGAGGPVSANRRQTGATAVEGDDLAGGHRRRC